MKKGDIRKQEILNTAENFFCRKGYEETSIQDILDQLKCSKGSFYHHFISKESLLSEICRKRAEQIYASALKEKEGRDDTTECLDILLSGMIPLKEEKLSFLMMFLSIFRLPEGKSIRNSYCEALSGFFRPGLLEIIEAGKQSGLISCSNPDTLSDICLCLINRLWVTVCEMILSSEEKGTETDMTEILGIVGEYRFALEKILAIPFGSLELISIGMIKSLTEQVHNHWHHSNAYSRE